jgi:rare lipoprotein A (peptidoglycan hydrolase)
MKRIAVCVASIFFCLEAGFAQEVVWSAADVPNYRSEGYAHYYGTRYDDGRPAQNGNVINPNELTAMSPDLPVGALARVLNTQNDTVVDVTIIANGPNRSTNRIIDVSRAAAIKLGMIDEAGTPQLNYLPFVVVTGLSGSSGANISKAGAPPMPNVPSPYPVAAAGTSEAAANIDAATAPAAVSTTAPEPTPTAVSISTPTAAPSLSTQRAEPTAAPITAPAAVSMSTPTAAPPPTTYQAAPITAPLAPAGARLRVNPDGSVTVNPPAPRPVSQTPQAAQPAPLSPAASLPVTTTTTPANSPGAITSTAGQQLSVNPTSNRTPPPAEPANPLPRDFQVAPVTHAASQNRANIAPDPSLYPPTEGLEGPFDEGKTYRIQVGAFHNEENARGLFDSLITVGLNPFWEPYADWFRVVLVNIPSSEMNVIAGRLKMAGVRTVFTREEQ